MARAVTAIVIALCLVACSDGTSESGEATTTTVGETTTTRDDQEPDPALRRFCEQAALLETTVSTLPTDSIESLRSGAAEAVEILEEMEADAPADLSSNVAALSAAATEMREAVEATDDLEQARGELAILQTPAVEETALLIQEFTDARCEG